jgi:hypothetical protein
VGQKRHGRIQSRDGFPGFVLAGLYGFYAYLKYLKLWEMERDQGTDGDSR